MRTRTSPTRRVSAAMIGIVVTVGLIMLALASISYLWKTSEAFKNFAMIASFPPMSFVSLPIAIVIGVAFSKIAYRVGVFTAGFFNGEPEREAKEAQQRAKVKQSLLAKSIAEALVELRTEGAISRLCPICRSKISASPIGPGNPAEPQRVSLSCKCGECNGTYAQSSTLA